MSLKVTTVSGLAEALGVSQPRVSVMKKRAWFPKGPPWDVEEVRSLWAANAKRSGGRVKAVRGSPKRAGSEARGRARAIAAESGVVPAPITPTPDGLDPIAKAERVLEAMAARLEEALTSGMVQRDDVEHVIKAVDTLRKAHKDYPEIMKRRGELVERADAGEAIGRAVTRAVQFAEQLAADFGHQAVQIAADPDLGEKGTAQIRRETYQWAMGRVRDLQESYRGFAEKEADRAG